MIKGKLVVIDNLNLFKTMQQSSDPIPDSAVVFIKNEGQIWTKGSYFGVQKTYTTVSKTDAGLAPKGGDSASSLISNVDTEWVLTTTSGNTPTWRKLPSAAFITASYTLPTATTSALGGIKVGSVNTDAFANLSGKFYSVSVDKNGLAYVQVPWTDKTYTLPTATSSTLGGVKVGTTLTDVTGYTAVHIKDGVIYYKDTNSTNYLPLSGGELSGHLTIKTSSFNGQLSIYRDNANGNSVINFANSSGNLGTIGICGSAGTFPGEPYFQYPGSTEHRLWHSGNLNISNYLPLSGGAINAGGYISFTSPASTSITNSTPFAITYGKIQAASPISIIADTDETNTEYIIMTSGYPVASATKANGLAVGKTTLTWKDSTVLTQSNASGILNGTYVNVTGDTMTGILKLPLGGIEVGDCSSDANQYRAFKAYNSNLSSSYAGGTTNYMCVGHSASAGNATEIGFTYSASASTSNSASLGFNNGNRLKIYYNGGSGVGTAKLCSAISGGTEYTLLHSGNYGSYALPLTGGTMTGTITSNVNSTTLKSFVFYGTEFLDNSGNINLIDTAASHSWNVIKYSPSGSTNRTYLLSVLKSGNVGIGTGSPSYKLHVNGSIYGSSVIVPNSGLIINSDGGDVGTTRALKCYNTAATFSSMNVGHSASKGNAAEYAFSFISSASTSNFASIGFYGGNRLRLYYNGGSGVGRATLTSDNATSPETEHTILTSGNWSSYVTSGGFNGGTITENLTISKANPLCLGSFSNGDATIYSSKASSWMRVYSNNASILFETQAYDATVETNATKNREMILFRNTATKSYHFCLNMPASYSASSTTATPDSLFFCNGTARITETLRIGAAGTGIESAPERYICCQGKTGTSYINFGYNESAGNIAELGYTHSSNGSASNRVYIGFYGKVNVECYYDGRVNIPGTLQIGGQSLTFVT